jgi:DNA-binding IclR family transcriptional regulator
MMREGGIQVIARAAAILRLCGTQQSGLSLGQISTALDLPRSTVQRIVSALAAEDLLRSDGTHRSVRTGPGLFALTAAQRVDVVEIAHPFLKELSEQTGETVDLALFKGDHMVFVDQVAGSHRLRAVSSVGEIFPLHNTANGKAALLLAQGNLYSDVAEDREEHTAGISAMGAAFKIDSGEIFAISIPMPSARYANNEPALRQHLMACRQQIELACRS